MFDPWLSSVAAAEVALATHASPEVLASRRDERLARLLTGALRDSRLYQRLYEGLDPLQAPLQQLPITRKAELMQQFDDWVTDPQLQLDGLRRFTADRSRIADAYLGHYVVWESSGSSGAPGIFVQDARAMAVYDALEALRRPCPRPMARLLDPAYLGERIAFVGATSGHFASTVSAGRLKRLNPAMGLTMSDISFLQPTDQLVAELNAASPSIVATYPSAAVLLAEERNAGRLRADLREVWTGGETLTPAMRRFVQQAFGCPVIDSYGASEFLTLASECRCQRLHLNCDWVILESVDRQGRAVPAGEFGDTTLLTNLANHVQPLIRYDLGDRIALHDRGCDCGSHLPRIEVQGRSDDPLILAGQGGRAVRVLPLALSTVLEDDAGLFDFQLVQTGPRELELSVPLHGETARGALRRAHTVLSAFLVQQGARDVRLACHSGRESRRGRGGKLQRVVALRP